MTALLIGKLGRSAEISLMSMLLNYKNICLGVDEHGKASVIEFANSQNIEINECFCFHPITSEKLQQVNLKVSNTFSNFGESSFVKLTTFKWYLIQDVMKKHSDKDHIIFSDLDVFWKSQIKSLPVDKKVLVFAQNDTPRNSIKRHYCTGIMIWKNNQKNRQILNKLYKIQLQNINQNILIPDEPIFNKES